jgi:Replication-relaxation
MAEAFVIRPIYHILLHVSPNVPSGLFQLHIGTAEQLCRLHYKLGCIKAVKARLKDLADHGYVQHDTIPSKNFRSPYYYSLGTKGAHYLRQAGLDVSDAYRASKEVDKHTLFVEHTLELNDVIIAAALLRVAKTGFYLHSFIHEHTLRRKPYKATWRVDGRTETHNLIPDAFLDFRYVTDLKRVRIPILLEHDRGTEQQQYFRRRIRAYIAFLRANAQQEMFGARVVTIAFTTFAGRVRLEQMRQWTKQELVPCDVGIRQSFVFANLLEGSEPCQLWTASRWQTPFQEEPIALLGG